MPLDLKIGENVIVPRTGYKSLILDADGNPFLLTSDGTREAVGAVAGVASVTGNGVDNTDPGNPRVTLADETETVLGAISDAFPFGGVLDGDSDGGYWVEYRLLTNAVASGVIKLQINGADTGCASRSVQNQNNTVTGTGGNTFEIFHTVGAGEQITGFISIRSRRTTGVRPVFITAYGAGTTSRTINGWYSDAGNITSLRFLTANADGFAAGSSAWLVKRHLAVPV
jgi:hypothetical protein